MAENNKENDNNYSNVKVSEKKKAEQALAIHKILFENAQDIILYVNMQGEIVNANYRAIETYGYTKAELLTKKITDIRHLDYYAEYERQMQIADTIGIVFELYHVRKDGRSFPVEVSAKSTFTGTEPLRIHIIRDVTERKEQEAKITWLANHDGLTKIPNRNHFLSHLEHEIIRSKRHLNKFAVMLFDIDKFKQINDVYGHDAGDVVLFSVADNVRKVLRVTDVIGRLGGDEFVVLQTDVNELNDIITLVAKINLAAGEPIAYKTTDLKAKISIGISLFPDDAEDVNTLLLYADEAMYRVKNNGGGGYAFYNSPAMFF